MSGVTLKPRTEELPCQVTWLLPEQGPHKLPNHKTLGRPEPGSERDGLKWFEGFIITSSSRVVRVPVRVISKIICQRGARDELADGAWLR